MSTTNNFDFICENCEVTSTNAVYCEECVRAGILIDLHIDADCNYKKCCYMCGEPHADSGSYCRECNDEFNKECQKEQEEERLWYLTKHRSMTLVSICGDVVTN